MILFYVFAGRPENVLAVSGLFLFEYIIVVLLGRKFKSVLSWPLLVVTIIWMLVGLWEIYCMEQKYSIRIDIFLIYPVLIIASFVGFSLSIGSIILSLFKKGR